MITQQQNRLCYHFDAETLWVEAWGPSGLRVRATREPAMPARNAAARPSRGTSHPGRRGGHHRQRQAALPDDEER